MKTPAQLAAHHAAVVRLLRLINRRIKLYPAPTAETTSLLAARDFWHAYARALDWAAAPPSRTMSGISPLNR